MFGTDKNKSQRPSVNVDTLIGSRTTIRGDISFSGGMHVDGTLIGTINADEGQDAVLVVSDKGKIEGELRAPHIVINGQVKGDVIATERLELAANARVEGNIYYKVIEMKAGAEVNGRILRADTPDKLSQIESRKVATTHELGKAEISPTEVSKLEVKPSENKSSVAKPSEAKRA